MVEIDKVVVVKISFLFFRRREARVARTLVQLYGSLYYFWEWLLVGHWTRYDMDTCSRVDTYPHHNVFSGTNYWIQAPSIIFHTKLI